MAKGGLDVLGPKAISAKLEEGADDEARHFPEEAISNEGYFMEDEFFGEITDPLTERGPKDCSYRRFDGASGTLVVKKILLPLKNGHPIKDGWYIEGATYEGNCFPEMGRLGHFGGKKIAVFLFLNLAQGMEGIIAGVGRGEANIRRKMGVKGQDEVFSLQF